MRTTWMRGNAWVAVLMLALVAAGCAHGGNGGAVVADAAGVRVDCDELKNDAPIAVLIDAKNIQSVDASLPTTHVVQICKGKHSLLWFAEGAKDLKINLLEEAKDGSTVKGKLAETMRCGKVDADDGTPLGYICLVKGGSGDNAGNLFYDVRVTTGNDKNHKVDPQVIIKEYP